MLRRRSNRIQIEILLTGIGTIGCLVAFGSIVALTTFMVINLGYVAQNMTTIEYMKYESGFGVFR